MSKVLVTGSGGGLGMAICRLLDQYDHDVIGFDHKNGDDVRVPDMSMSKPPQGLDVLINCAGINVTNWLPNVTSDEFYKTLHVNAGGIFEMSRWALPSLAETKGTIINIVSNASHMPMTCSLAYNASKGAAHIMTLQMSRELSKSHGITVFGISPNKLAGTGMSAAIERQVVEQRGWTAEQAKAYQLAALPAGEETPPYRVADFIRYLLTSKDHHKYLAGTVIPYGA